MSGAAGSTPPAGPIAIGVLGLGTAGRSAIAAIARSARCALVACCDLDAALVAQQSRAGEVAGHRSVGELAADPAVEAVYLATPTAQRLAHVEELASAGKHLLIEKPLGRNGAEAARIARRCAEEGIVAVAVNTRGRDPAIRLMASIVASGELGRVLGVTNLNYAPWILRPRYPYELDPDLGGGVIFRQAPHQVEIVRSVIASPIVSVCATATHSREPVETVAGYHALIRFADGASASLVYNGYGYFDTAELTGGIGENGMARSPGAGVRLRRLAAWAADKYGVDGEHARRFELSEQAGDAAPVGLSTYGLTIVSCEGGDLRQTSDGVAVYDGSAIRPLVCDARGSGLDGDLEEFWGALREGLPPRHGVAWGAETARVCEAIATSAVTGRPA